LVDEVVKTQQFGERVKKRVAELAQGSDRPANAKGIVLSPLRRTIDEDGLHYETIDAVFNRDSRTVTITVKAPELVSSQTIEGATELGAEWWPLKMARELDDAILSLRTHELELGLWILKTTGEAKAVRAMDEFILKNAQNWFVREVLGMMRRTFARLDVTSRSMYAVIEPGSCFVGTLLELALAADRVYMLDTQEGEARATAMLSEMNFGPLPMVNHLSRLEARFYQDEERIKDLHSRIGQQLAPSEAVEAGLVTAAPDDLDWQDELRIAIESRAALSPDALTGLEANLRFGLPETLETRVFGRLSAWQNWIFIRPNAVGPNGALKVYGSGSPVKFIWEKV
jgi:benzoyl-CoA-dihydrodiol lyase